MTAPPRRVVVTGASGGIGGAIARRFAREGAAVVSLDARPGGGDLRTVLADLADEAAVTSAFAQVDAFFAHAPPDVLVCCAAVSAARHFLDVPAAEFDRLMAVNVRGTFLVCQAAARRMRDAGGGGRIVVVTSVAAEQAWAGEAVYCATKAAQRALVQAMAVELAPFGILVNALGPGIVEHRGAAMASTRDDGEVLRHDLERTPLGRFGAPEEMAEAAWFLASATWTTGQTLYVDGGFLGAGLAYFGRARASLSEGSSAP